MHKNPLYAIHISDIKGVHQYEFWNYSVKDNGLEINKPHFEVQYIYNDELEQVISRPSGVYIFGYSLPNVMKIAAHWFHKHIASIDEHIARLQGMKKMLGSGFDRLKNVHEKIDRVEDSDPSQQECRFTAYIITEDERYCALIIDNTSGKISPFSGTAPDAGHSLWQGLVDVLEYVSDRRVQHSIRLHTIDDIADEVHILYNYDQEKAGRFGIPGKLGGKLMQMVKSVILVPSDIDPGDENYHKCMDALRIWN